MTHKYRLNQRVQLAPATSVQKASPDGFYDIVGLMPQSLDGQFSYRLKSQAGERVALESALVFDGLAA